MVHTPPARSYVPVLRALAACSLVGGSLALAGSSWKPLPEVLAAEGLVVRPSSVRWLDGPGLRMRRALVLAHRGNDLDDVFAIGARTDPFDRVISLHDVSNLTRSPNASETDLAAIGDHAAFATRVRGEVIAFSVVDARGEPTSGSHPRTLAARVRSAVTRYQQTGRVRGYGLDRYDLDRSATEIVFRFGDAFLEARTPSARFTVDLGSRRVITGSDQVRMRPRMEAEADGWITWAVDTVRAVPWIGPTPIVWLEGIAFRARTAARQASHRVAHRADDTRRDIAEDLADLAIATAPSGIEGPVENWPPPRLQSPVGTGVPAEGAWSPVGAVNDPFARANPGAPPPLYLTFVRTDRAMDDLRVYVVAWDPSQVELHVGPGSQEPMGATGETGSGAIPREPDTLRHVLAGFNGAFQGLHGEFGLLAEGALLLPPKPYGATVALMADGMPGFGTWPPDLTDIPDSIIEFRQNLTPLIDHGIANPWRRNDWGPVLGNDPAMRTARTGLCLTRENQLDYFWGDNLSPRDLSVAMLAARCEYGLHLDMNGSNTGFELYRADDRAALPPLTRRLNTRTETESVFDEVPTMAYRSRRLVRSMVNRLAKYIERNPRDFFYLLLRPVLPGADLAPVVTPAQPGEGMWHVAGLGDTPFPWPLARTRIRPDTGQPERTVSLVRIDARRVRFGRADETENVVARVAGGQAVDSPGGLRIAMTDGAAGPQWVIDGDGTGLSGDALGAGSDTLRGGCVDRSGFLVLAVADRAVPDLVRRALEHAGCVEPMLALRGASLVLANGESVAGDAGAGRAAPVLSLVRRPFPTAHRLFEQVTPVAPVVWGPALGRRVRYFTNPGNHISVRVRLAGQSTQVFRLAGALETDVRAAYPDGGAPPPATAAGN